MTVVPLVLFQCQKMHGCSVCKQFTSAVVYRFCFSVLTMDMLMLLSVLGMVFAASLSWFCLLNLGSEIMKSASALWLSGSKRNLQSSFRSVAQFAFFTCFVCRTILKPGHTLPLDITHLKLVLVQLTYILKESLLMTGLHSFMIKLRRSLERPWIKYKCSKFTFACS